MAFNNSLPNVVATIKPNKVIWRNLPDSSTQKIRTSSQAYFEPTPIGGEDNTVRIGDICYIDAAGLVRKYIDTVTTVNDIRSGSGSVGFVSRIQQGTQSGSPIAQAGETITYTTADNAPLVTFETAIGYEAYEDQLSYIDNTGTRQPFEYNTVVLTGSVLDDYIAKGPNTYGTRQMIKFTK